MSIDILGCDHVVKILEFSSLHNIYELPLYAHLLQH